MEGLLDWVKAQDNSFVVVDWVWKQMEYSDFVVEIVVDIQEIHSLIVVVDGAVGAVVVAGDMREWGHEADRRIVVAVQIH